MHDLGGRIEQSSLKDKVLAILRKNLITGDLVEGELYSAAAIASELGVSTSPVREALLTLVDQGVMEAVRNRGYRVLPLGESDRQEIYQMRSLLEIPSMVSLAGHPAVLAREAEFRAKADDIVEAVAAGDMVAYLEADLAFHLDLLRILGNERLTATVKSLRDQTRQLKLAAQLGSAELTRTARSHLLLLDAMVAGDAEGLQHLMVDHLEHIRTDWGSATTDAPSTQAAS
ncbi:DNA-binding transcriptional regulator, GntR family [Nakamurella panacisegetis]|uniref:DNA-binding transcriptional regulator, GntR family n=1 Tax=Nakamurella panacisegetis TaxID=1090615 RepID=A0A1H0S856_9ACTN|nr:GntR family transcriptional regulator [Nakamurella panacisegetis]SDP37406.1 DNA-binding transcriptional regulator, GntR family [Nakamurella panacisegetis]